MDKKYIAISIVVMIIVGGASFYCGMKYGSMAGRGRNASGAANFQPRGQFPGGLSGARSGLAGGGVTMGEVINRDDQSVTIKLPDGGSKIIILSDSTTINKTAPGTNDDLAIGTTLSVVGKTNDDGSITADMIQLRPQLSVSQPSQNP